MSELHKNEFPFTAGHTSTQAEIRALDAVSDELHVLPEVLVKIDVQGYEDKVIAGGRGLIARAAVVIVEVNLELLFEGSQLLMTYTWSFATWASTSTAPGTNCTAGAAAAC